MTGPCCALLPVERVKRAFVVTILVTILWGHLWSKSTTNDSLEHKKMSHGELRSMRLLATASGARPPVRRRPLNLSERHFSSITRNPTQPHQPLPALCGQSRFTTLGSSGSRLHGERSIHVPARRASRERRRTKNKTRNGHKQGQRVRSEENACPSKPITLSR